MSYRLIIYKDGEQRTLTRSGLSDVKWLAVRKLSEGYTVKLRLGGQTIFFIAPRKNHAENLDLVWGQR